jgi:NLR family CARD domain-containing protein 3
MGDIANAVSGNMTLEKLSMQGCSLSDVGCGYIMDGLSRNRSLLELAISNNNLRAASAKRIAEVLSSKDLKLTSLVLSSNYLGDAGANQIAKALATNRFLQKIDLFDNNLRDDSVKEIMHVLSRNNTVLSVNLGWNGCNERYVRKVEQMAKKNEQITRLSEIPRQVKQIKMMSVRSRYNDSLFS